MKQKAWAFLGGGKFIANLDGETEIYLKKPKPILNPFTLGKWNPTKIIITIPKKI